MENQYETQFHDNPIVSFCFHYMNLINIRKANKEPEKLPKQDEDSESLTVVRSAI